MRSVLGRDVDRDREVWGCKGHKSFFDSNLGSTLLLPRLSDSVPVSGANVEGLLVLYIDGIRGTGGGRGASGLEVGEDDDGEGAEVDVLRRDVAMGEDLEDRWPTASPQ